MDPGRALTQEAAWAVRSIEGGGQMDRATEARMRLMGYKPKLDLNRYQCPRCWVRNAMKNALTPVPGTDDYDVLRCHGCGADFVIPF